MKPCLILYATLILLSSCSGWNSELTNADINNKSKDSNPLCSYNVKNNCWSQSLKSLMSCVQPVTKFPEKLGKHSEACTNESGKWVYFGDTLNDVKENGGEFVQFKVWDGNTPCFRFTGTPNNFTIDETGLGRLKVVTKSGGDLEVTCFSNETFIIPKAVKSLGCKEQKASPEESIPHFELVRIKLKDKKGSEIESFQFNFMGAGAPLEPLFRCQN